MTDSTQWAVTFVKVVLKTRQQSENSGCLGRFFSMQDFNVKLFGNTLPLRALTVQSYIELSSPSTPNAASIFEHMPLSVSARLRLCVSLSHGVARGGQGQQLCVPESITAHMTWWKARGKHKLAKRATAGNAGLQPVRAETLGSKGQAQAVEHRDARRVEAKWRDQGSSSQGGKEGGWKAYRSWGGRWWAWAGGCWCIFPAASVPT